MTQPRVCLLEDDANEALLAQRAMAKVDPELDFVVFSDGWVALEQLSAWASKDHPQICPHLLILDLKMPCISGLEVLRQLRGDPQLRFLPVVVFTTSRHPEDLRSCYEAGANGFVQKPIRLADLITTFHHLIEFWVRCNVHPLPSRAV